MSEYQECHTPKFTPHYYNLDLPISATQEDIKQAHHRLLQLIRPDNLRGPEQTSSAENAIQLINEAFEVLSNDEKRHDHRNICEKTFGCHFRSDFQPRFGLDFWNSKWINKHHESKNFAPKPWPWHYDTLSTTSMCPTGGKAGLQFCTATWVNLAHILVDNLLPYSVSDNIWRRVETWRSGSPDNETIKDVYLDFQRGCDNYKVMVEKKEAYIPWSQIPANTDWPTLGDRCQLFCDDILIAPVSIIFIIDILLLLVGIQIIKNFESRQPSVFLPPSAMSDPASTDLTIEDNITKSQKQSQSRASQQQSFFHSSEGDYYADEEITPRYPPDKPQHHTAKGVSKRVPNRFTNPPETSKPTRYSNMMIRQGRATNPATTNPTTNSMPKRYQDPNEPHPRSSTPSTSTSSSTQFFTAEAHPPPSPVHASQFFSLNPSEKHYYYSNHDLPLRERRNPSASYPPTRQRYVHYEDEKDWADNERTPRLCMALTVTGKQCSRRVSMAIPLSGTTVEGLVSPLCFQHRHVREWVRSANERISPLSESVSSSDMDSSLDGERRGSSVRSLEEEEEEDDDNDEY